MKCSLRVFLSDFASVRYDGVEWTRRDKNAERSAVAQVKAAPPEHASLIRSSMAFKVEMSGREVFGGRIRSVEPKKGQLRLACHLEDSILT